MKLYDDVLIKLDSLIKQQDCKNLVIGKPWPSGDKNQIIFKSEEAYELGEGNLPALSGVVITSDNDLVSQDEIILIGDDLSDIKGNTPYARIALIRVNDEALGEGNTLYQNIRKIDYTRYHINLDGFMLRISSMSQKECARVSKKAIKNGIGFASVGKAFIDEYHSKNAVEAVKMIFITKKDFPFDELNSLLNTNENKTKALDHLVNKVKMDCHSCSLQVVCNEVEKMVEEDFKKKDE